MLFRSIYTNDATAYFDKAVASEGTSASECLQSYSESAIKTQGSYSLKGIAAITDSLNDTLTRTVSPTIDLSNRKYWEFYIYSSRTGSNIKLGIKDSGGTATETTPNITSTGAWQKVKVDISGVAKATDSLNDTLTRTVSPTIDLSNQKYWEFYIYSSRTGSNIKLGIKDSGGTATETIPNITSTGVWQKVSIDISAVSNANKDAISEIKATVVNADAANTFYLDDMYGEFRRRKILIQ